MTITTLTTEQKQTFTLNPVTALGNASSIQPGSLAIENLDGALTVNVINDSTIEIVTPDAVDTPAVVVNFEVAGDADLGDGVTRISESFQVIVTVPTANGFGVTAGDITAK